MASDKKRFSDKGLRLQSWDYGWNGKYFITINTKDKVECFGDVISEELYHSAQGKLANEFWEMIPEKFPFAKLDEFIVMPNHVHGIIEIDKSLKCRHAINRMPTFQGTIGGFAGQKIQCKLNIELYYLKLPSFIPKYTVRGI